MPNIVMFLADDLGYGDLSCYGNTSINTPNIDFLAEEGIRFTDFHSNGSVCSPTRAALMTGKYQQRTGVAGVVTAAHHRHVGMGMEQVTIAEELKKYNYNCAMYGKWHLGYPKEYNPTLQGFDDFVGFVSGNVDYHAHIDQEGYLDWWKGDAIDNEEGYLTDLITDYGVKYIRQNNPQKSNKPFFLYLPHGAPHYPYQNRERTILREIGKAGSIPMPKDSIAGIYKEMVELMDGGVGKIVQTLKETGQYENTIIIFLSDNGANNNGSNGKLRGFKSGVYEGGSRVPALISYPAKIAKGKTSDQTILTMDLLPTILDFIGQRPEAGDIDGISVKNHLLHDTPVLERDIFYAFKGRSFVRNGPWKMISIKKEDSEILELYNLSSDLSESHDLSNDRPDLLEKMKEKLALWEANVDNGVDIVSQ